MVQCESTVCFPFSVGTYAVLSTCARIVELSNESYTFTAHYMVNMRISVSPLRAAVNSALDDDCDDDATAPMLILLLPNTSQIRTDMTL